MSNTPSGPMTAADADPTGQSASSARRSMAVPPKERRRGDASFAAECASAGECASICIVVDTAAERAIALLDDVDRSVAREPLLDIALGPALLQYIAGAGGPELLRLYRPRPTLAFSGRDAATVGIAAAAAAAQRAGFAPLRRGPGGRAAAYHSGALCIDHVGTEPLGASGVGQLRIKPRFIEYGNLLVRALRGLGVDAGLGPVPGEYCPGEFSINDGHGHKLVGTAQRLVRGAWLFGTVILVADPEPVREVLIAVYDALRLDWDPATVGAVQSTVPGVRIEDVRAAVRQAYGQLATLRPASLDDAAVELALGRVDRHRVPE